MPTKGETSITPPVSSGFPSAAVPTGRRGKTVQIRRGAAAVIGQALEPTIATVPGQGWAWEGGSGTVKSRKPEDLPAECGSVLRTQLPTRMRIVRTRGHLGRCWAGAFLICPARQKASPMSAHRLLTPRLFTHSAKSPARALSRPVPQPPSFVPIGVSTISRGDCLADVRPACPNLCQAVPHAS